MTVGVLIFFAAIGSVICAKTRVSGGAVFFALLALVLFIGTPAGAGLPGMVADFLAAIGQASQPLTGGGSRAVG